MRRFDQTDTVKNREDAAAVARAEILRLAESKRTTLATGFTDLFGDGGPSDETADEMIEAIRMWRDTSSIRSLD